VIKTRRLLFQHMRPLIIGALLFWPPANPAFAETKSSPVLVRFNKATYTAADIDKMIETNPSFSLLSKQKSGDISGLRHFVASQMIDRQLLRTYASESKGIVQAEVEAGLDRIIQGYGGKEQLAKLLTPIGSTLQQFSDDMRIDLEIGSFIQHVIMPELTVSEDEINAWYKEHGEELATPERVRARQILLPVGEEAAPDEVSSAKKHIENIRAIVIKSPEKFNTYAQKFNQALPSRGATTPVNADNDYIGTFSKGMMLPEVEKIAFTLKKGAISEPIRSRVGFHLLKVEGNLPSTIPPLPDVHDKVLEIVKKKKSDEKIEQILIKLRSKADIVFE
jgi:peptidyl-prolyl cis-trans isomerase C